MTGTESCAEAQPHPEKNREREKERKRHLTVTLSERDTTKPLYGLRDAEVRHSASFRWGIPQSGMGDRIRSKEGEGETDSPNASSSSRSSGEI